MADEEKTLTYNDAYDILSKKILINKIALENMQYQKVFLSNCKILQDYNLTTLNKKMECVVKLNELFEQQLAKFTEERQDECILLYKKLSELEQPTTEVIQVHNVLNETEERMKDLCVKIDALERTIPAEKIITQYSVKPKVELVD